MNLFQRWMQPGSPRKPAWPFTQTQRAPRTKKKAHWPKPVRLDCCCNLKLELKFQSELQLAGRSRIAGWKTSVLDYANRSHCTARLSIIGMIQQIKRVSTELRIY